ncbi:VENN motif pre-toxin domain-containing protein [Erwinia sp. 198]|uniref:VENN motif pre-toxin domain-containing protein n=1 Tax=Erwinia sp. 198 TaxID=2022746 RepID=UPI0013152F54|nr:VENN motif pre-toxin domain-containing protein [Erwinia sp. 198]
MVKVETNLIVHAVPGAALAGASGGATGKYIAQQLYPDSVVTGALARENAVENNALSGDNARQPVKESAEWWKKQARDKLGKGTTSATANSIINAIADSGDTATGSADYVADAAMMLASCATGNGYCPQALNNLSGKTRR